MITETIPTMDGDIHVKKRRVDWQGSWGREFVEARR